MSGCNPTQRQQLDVVDANPDKCHLDEPCHAFAAHRRRLPLAPVTQSC